MEKFYLCSVCGNLVEKVIDGNTNPNCCGRPMRELRPESTDGALEKHVPIFQVSFNTGDNGKVKRVLVQIGAIEHPMEKTHYIEWIEIETDKGTQRKRLYEGSDPVALFYIADTERILNIYAYCNLHGLYVNEVNSESIMK